MDGMPKPTQQHLKLKRFVGQWEGKEKLSPSPWGPGGEATGRYTGRLDLEGFFVIQDHVEEKDGKIVFRGHGIFGWDSNDKKYTWYWVDSMGQVPAIPSRGESDSGRSPIQAGWGGNKKGAHLGPPETLKR